MLHLKCKSTFSKWPKQAGVFVHSPNAIQNRFKIWSKELEHGKETFSTKNVFFLTCKSQNAYLLGSNLRLWEQNKFIAAKNSRPH